MNMEMDLEKKKQVMMMFTIDPKTGVSSKTQKVLIDYNKVSPFHGFRLKCQ